MAHTLTASEREVVLTVADDEDGWSVHSTSTRFSRRLQRIAAAWGITATPGSWFTLPLKAVRFVAPPSAKRRAAGSRAGERLQNARRAAETLVALGSSDPQGVQGGK